jgi:hypothetical protein
LVIALIYTIGHLCKRSDADVASEFSVNTFAADERPSDSDGPFRPLDDAFRSVGDGLSWLDRNIRTALFLLLFLYLPVVNAVLTIFPLDDQGYLLHAAYLSAQSARVSFARSMAWLFVAMYVIGLPALITWLVRSGRRRSSAVAQFSVSCYRTECSHWEGIVLLRRLLMSVAVALIDPASVLLPCAVYLIYFLAFTAHVMSCPFTRPFDNLLEQYSLLALLICSPFVIAIRDPTLPHSQSVGLAVVAVHAAVAVVLVVATVAKAVKSRI